MEKTIKELEEIRARISKIGASELNKKTPISITEMIEYLKPWVTIEIVLDELIIQLKAKTVVSRKPEHVIPLETLKSMTNGNND